ELFLEHEVEPHSVEEDVIAAISADARRLALWREGRRVRPALWVAFVALFALAWGPGSVLLSLVLGIIAGMRG
ncbi:MAG TPA: hypothetical protein VF619_02720, partial [Allosphingosinicella sp.]